MARLPVPLPPGVVPVVFTYSDGTSETIYRSPVRSEGPLVTLDEDGRQSLTFMYDFFVFNWPAGHRTVDILHGRLPVGRPDNMMVCRAVSLDAAWDAEVLSRFAVRWVAARRNRIRIG